MHPREEEGGRPSPLPDDGSLVRYIKNPGGIFVEGKVSWSCCYSASAF
jgi:hypothetical protein